jgi:demethylmenaquinone methyltransferase/2-methoxy-6-polyprenyl-1,4-benzoquinol methylase
MSNGQNPEAGWFGFQKIDPAQKTSAVGEVFASVAGNYDIMNDLMSGGLHRLWKDRFVRRCGVRAGQKVLDVAGGTGDIALRLLRATDGQLDLTVSDINPAMLERGQAKLLDQGWLQGRGTGTEDQGQNRLAAAHSPQPAALTFALANAEDLPFPNRSFDLVTIAFGLRNVARIDQALREFYRVLKPGGRLAILEFSPAVVRPLQPLYRRYCFTLLPLLGKYVARDEAAYRYLAESIQQFPPPPQLARRLTQAGFSQTNWLNFSGGICVMHQGRRL